MLWTKNMLGKNFFKVVVQNHVFRFKCVRSISTNENIRVRFAPSPTGYLHLGGLRTALYNYLFAKSHGGTFVLRIEDTDQSRVVPGALQQLEKDLEWAGIISDEGPSPGGSFGPYVQSKRVKIYTEEVDKLLDNGTAYYCFCTERRLDLLRREAMRLRQVPRYDNRCRHLNKGEIAEKLEKGLQKCVRFKLQSGVETFSDLVYGEISLDVASIEGDPIIIKTDGFPTYHLANVVDDHYMKISHVLRGVEWQSSTTKHIYLYKAFGWEPPQFAHLPLLMNDDGTKLSKRQGDITINHFKKAGILPRALVNFVTYSGGGFHREAHERKELITYTVDKLSKMFDMKLLSSNSCRVNLKRLDDFNLSELIRLMSNPVELSHLVSELRQLVKETLKDRIDGSLELDDNHVQSVLLWSQKRIHRLSDLVGPNLTFLWVRPSFQQLDLGNAEVIIDLMASLSTVEDFTKDPLNVLLKQTAEKHGVPFKVFMKHMRSILSGLKEGPGVAEMLQILGKKTSLARMQRAVEFLKLNQKKTLCGSC